MGRFVTGWGSATATVSIFASGGWRAGRLAAVRLR